MLSLVPVASAERGSRLMRLFAWIGALLVALLITSLAAPPSAQALSGGGTRLHDPSVIKVGSCYYAFSTGFAGDNQNPNGQITQHRSCGSAEGPWTKVQNIFQSTPSWVTDRIGPSNFGNVWSPDINFVNGKYYLYYSVARSTPSWAAVLGVATATNIDGPWTDQGFVTDVEFPIDPDVFTDVDGTMYINWGSFGGIFQHVLNPATGKLSTTDNNLWHLATDVEGTAMIRNGDYYYLFASDGPCCSGIQSNYWTVVGRSTSPHGPFIDQSGASLLTAGAGTTTLVGSWPKTSAGGGDLYTDGQNTFMAYHYYDGANNGRETLDIRPLSFNNGWPVFGTPIGQTTFHLLNSNSRSCADVWNASTADQAAVNQGFCNSGTNQQWRLQPVGSNVQLINVNSGKCLEMYGFTTTAGAPAVQYGCNGGANQLWTKTATIGGFVTFRNVNSGQCLEIYGNQTADAVTLSQWPCNGGRNQQWSIG